MKTLMARQFLAQIFLCLLHNLDITGAKYIRSSSSLYESDDVLMRESDDELAVRELDWSFGTEWFNDNVFFDG